MAPPRFSERIRYRFDTFMSRGGRSIFISLVIVFLILFALLVAGRWISMSLDETGVSRETHDSLAGQAYVIFLEMTDPGNMNQDKFASPFMKATGVAAGLVGVIILSMLIAFITTALDQKLAALRKGFSRVIENDHTLILGWNDRIIEILRELVIANESEKDASVVILADHPKEDMDDHLSMHLKERKTTRVVTRSGKPSAKLSLDTASLNTCKSVIVLATCSDAAAEAEKAASDTRIIKTLLGIMASRESDEKLNIVAELFLSRSREMAVDISPDEIMAIDGPEILARILVQTSRSVGLSVVYSEALSFDGCELYFHSAQWNRITFANVQYHFPDGVPIGVRHQDGTLEINPPIDLVLEDSDDVLILAEDDSTIEFLNNPVATPGNFELANERNTQQTERELLIGWNEKVPTIISEYDDYVLSGSKIDVMVRQRSARIDQEIEQLNDRLENVTVSLMVKDPTLVESLRDVAPYQYDNIIILSQSPEDADPETTDSETIVILLLLRQLFEELGAEAVAKTKIITEVMDSENQELVARAGVNDFIISNRFVSTILAQISEEADIKRVYDDLFSEDGSEIYLKPASLYFTDLPAERSFADMMAIAQKREEVCMGVKVKSLEKDINQNFGVTLIPEKNSTYQLQPDDCLIVVAEDET
jgi:hypothetical protein